MSSAPRGLTPLPWYMSLLPYIIAWSNLSVLIHLNLIINLEVDALSGYDVGDSVRKGKKVNDRGRRSWKKSGEWFVSHQIATSALNSDAAVWRFHLMAIYLSCPCCSVYELDVTSGKFMHYPWLNKARNMVFACYLLYAVISKTRLIIFHFHFWDLYTGQRNNVNWIISHNCHSFIVPEQFLQGGGWCFFLILCPVLNDRILYDQKWTSSERRRNVEINVRNWYST